MSSQQIISEKLMIQYKNSVKDNSIKDKIIKS